LWRRLLISEWRYNGWKALAWYLKIKWPKPSNLEAEEGKPLHYCIALQLVESLKCTDCLVSIYQTVLLTECFRWGREALYLFYFPDLSVWETILLCSPRLQWNNFTRVLAFPFLYKTCSANCTSWLQFGKLLTIMTSAVFYKATNLIKSLLWGLKFCVNSQEIFLESIEPSSWE